MGRARLSVVLIIVCAVKCLAMTYDELEDFTEHLKKTSQLSPTLKKGVEPDDYDEDEDVSDHAWEDSGKFEGDLILNERQRRLIIEDVAEGLARNGIKDGTKRWPDNEVIYYIQVEHFNSDQVQAIESGIEDLGRASCVKFRPYKKGDRDAVVIQGSRRGCFSQVGYQGGYQVLNLSSRHPVGRGCFRHGTVVHELLHTLGFFHMQSSPDRDDYVNVIWSNIIQPARHNFRKYNSFAVSDFGVGYDYDSVLHYSRRAFSANGQDTIVPKQSGVQIGQRLGLSDKDTQKLNKMYCDADSDNSQADENPSKKIDNKKKNGKNKPFEGHGIGYHQGKAVAIKLLPAPETYKLPDVPSFHVFDYFSKEPQILSTSENEAFRIGKEIAYSYNPPDMTSVSRENDAPADINTEPETKPDEKGISSEMQINNYSDITELKPENPLMEKELSDSNNTSDTSQDGSNKGPEAENTDPDLIEAFDRLSKIIKLHVYPSQTPDLRIYKMNERYINHYNPQEMKKVSVERISSTPTKEDKLKNDKMNSAMRFINNFNDFSADKSFSYSSEKPHVGESAKYKKEQIRNNMKDTSVEVAPNKENIMKNHLIPSYRITFPLNKQYEDITFPLNRQYVSTSGFESPEQYRIKDEYKSINSPKILNDEKLNEDEDEWHQKFTPFYPDHDYYTDYSHDNSRGNRYHENPNESTHSSSIPVKTQEYPYFDVPVHMVKNWYKTKDAIHGER